MVGEVIMRYDKIISELISHEVSPVCIDEIYNILIDRFELKIRELIMKELADEGCCQEDIPFDLEELSRSITALVSDMKDQIPDNLHYLPF